MSNVNYAHICNFQNLTGRPYTYMHITNSDVTDTFIIATCYYVSGTITLDNSDHKMIAFLTNITNSSSNVNCGKLILNCMQMTMNNVVSGMSKVT